MCLGTGFAFLCPNGTLFNQQVFVCDWYRHVDCSASANFYAKNDELNMNITNMSDMMAVVTEMMNFPLKTTPTPTVPATVATNAPVVPAQQRQTTTPATLTPTARLQFDGKTTISPNLLPVNPAAVNQFGDKIIDTNTPRAPSLPVTPNAPNLAAGGQQTITKEGDFANNFKTNTDRLNTDTNTQISNQPIFVSNLGELSTDAGTKFDINNSKIVKPDTNNPITPAPISTKQQATNQLKQSLAQSFQQRQNSNAAIPQRTISDSNLLQSLQQVLRQNPDAISGEADLIEFVQRILERNPDLTPDQLNAILSAESDSIVDILANSVNRNQNSPAEAKRDGKNQLLDSIQSVLNKYKTGTPVPAVVQSAPNIGNAIPFVQQTPAIGTTAPNFQSTPVISSSGLPVSVAIPIPVSAPVPVAIVKNTPVIGSPIPIAQSTPIIARPIEVIRGTPIIGSPVQPPAPISVPVAVPVTIQTPIVRTTPAAGRQRVQVLSGVIEPQIIEFDRPAQTPIVQSAQLPLPPTTTQFVNNQRTTSNQNFKPIPNVAPNSIQQPAAPVSAASLQNQPPFGALPSQPSLPQAAAPQTVANALPGTEAIESGEADLVQILQQILLRTPNQLAPIFSGEADIVTFIEQIKRQNPDFSVKQLNAIISGEADSILQILNGSAQRNLEKGYPQVYEADLLEAIQLVIQKYRANTQSQPLSPPLVPALREPVFSGEGDLISASLKRIQARIPVPIFSGSADLLEFIRRIEQRNPNLTRDQLNAILSGEADSILQIFNERRAQNGGAQNIYSGSADLLEAIQQVRNTFFANQFEPKQ